MKLLLLLTFFVVTLSFDNRKYY